MTELERLAHQSRTLHPNTAPTKAGGEAMRSLRRRLAPHTIEELVARYEAGEHTPALSRAYGISKTGLRELLQAEGVTMRRQAITPEDTLRAVQLYGSGLTIKEIVRQVGYSYGTIRRVLHENGVAMRPTGIEQRAASNERPQ